MICRSTSHSTSAKPNCSKACGTKIPGIDVFAVKMGTVIPNIATVLGFAFYINDRTSKLPPSGLPSLDIVLHLGLLAAIFYGIIWKLADRINKWGIDAGGDRAASGWSAVMLSLSLTIPLTFIPPLYQSITGVRVVTSQHWVGMVIVVLLNIGAHLIMFGTKAVKRNGLRDWFMPGKKRISFPRYMVEELVWTTLLFVLAVLPYRLIVDNNGPLLEVLWGRILLPILVQISAMAVFSGIQYPSSVMDPKVINARGMICGTLTCICMCGGLFL